MADNSAIDGALEAPLKRKGVKRRAFLIGGIAVVGPIWHGRHYFWNNALRIDWWLANCVGYTRRSKCAHYVVLGNLCRCCCAIRVASDW